MVADGEDVRGSHSGRIGGGLRHLGQVLAFAVVMFAVCWVSIDLPQRLGRSVPIWPPNALAISLLIITPRRRWPAWLVGAWLGDMAASLAAGEPMVMSLALCNCNLVAIIVTGWALHRYVGDQLDLARTDHLLKFSLIAGLAAPMVSALVAGLTLGGLDTAKGLTMLASWVAANGLGSVIVVPLVLTLRDQGQLLRETPLNLRSLLALGVLALTTALALSAREPLAFLIPPALMVVVFQMERLGAAWGALIIFGIILALTLAGHPPSWHSDHDPARAVLVAQLFFAAIILTSLPTAAVLTQRRRFQAQVADSEALYRLVTEASRDVVLEYDLDGVIRFASQASRLYGYEPAELIGRCAFEVIHPMDRAEAVALSNALTGDSKRTRAGAVNEFRICKADGGYVWVEGNPSVIRDADGVATGFTNALRDITRRKAIERELRAAREAAEAAAAVKADFLANMSHELRTPLTSVLGFTQLALAQGDLSPASQAYIRKASNAGAALLATVNDILDFSKLESGQLQIRLEPCDTSLVCQETLELFSEAAAAKGVSLRFEAADAPARVAVDPSRLRQLLLNLVGNAVKFSDGGEVLLALSWSPEDERLLVSVKDQGPGIAREQQTLLFRRFSQVDGSSTRRHGGTGLGLAICMGLVEAMGGTIGVESELGQGARFYFEIPAALAIAQDEADDDEALVFPVGVRVLVADDHAANRELVRAVLAPFGAEVTEAENGAAAIEAAAAPFDLILMDLRMPILDGHGAMSAIRAGEGPNRATPILAFSAGADAPGAAERRRAGFDGDLAKPILPVDLIEAVCRHARFEHSDDPAQTVVEQGFG